MTSTSIRDTIARNTFWYGLVTVVGLIAGLAMSVVLARGLGPALMGDYSYLMWLGRTLEAVSMLGFGVALVRFSAASIAQGEPAVARGVITLLNRWQLASATLVATVTIVLALALAPENLRWPIVVGAVALVPATTESLYMRATYGAQRYDLTAQISTIKMALLLTISIAAVLMGGGVLGIVVGLALGGLVSCALQTRRALALYPREPAPVPPALRTELRQYLISFSIVCALEALVWDRSEILFLKLWLPSQDVAFYSLAFGLASRAMILPAIFVGVLLPAFAALHGAGDDREFGRVYRTSLRSVALVGAPIAAVIAGVAPALVDLLYGPVYSPVVSLFRVLVGVSLLGVLRDVAWAALRATGDRRTALSATVVTAVVDLALAAALIRTYGTGGAVAANTVAQLTVSVWAFVAIQRMKRAGFPVRDLVRIAVASALALLVSSTATASHGTLLLALGTAAGFGAYALACVLLGAVNGHDWMLLRASSRRIASFWARA